MLIFQTRKKKSIVNPLNSAVRRRFPWVWAKPSAVNKDGAVNAADLLMVAAHLDMI